MTQATPKRTHNTIKSAFARAPLILIRQAPGGYGLYNLEDDRWERKPFTRSRPLAYRTLREYREGTTRKFWAWVIMRMIPLIVVLAVLLVASL